MNTLKDILENDELLRTHPQFGGMNIKLFLSVCAGMKQEAVHFFGREDLLRILQLANRRWPQYYHEYYLNTAKDPAFYRDFFPGNMSLISTEDLEKRGDERIEEIAASLREKGLFTGNLHRYQPDSSPEEPITDPFDGDALRVVPYRADFLIEELKILANSGSAPLCTVPIFSSWGNDYTHDTGEAPDPLGEEDHITGHLFIEITGFDHETDRFIFTPIHFEEKETAKYRPHAGRIRLEFHAPEYNIRIDRCGRGIGHCALFCRPAKTGTDTRSIRGAADRGGSP
jgi:hypothetical protein